MLESDLFNARVTVYTVTVPRLRFKLPAAG